MKGRLGEILVANGLITPEQLERGLAAQAQGGKRLGRILVEQGVVSEDDIAWALSTQLGYPYVSLTPSIIDEEAVRLLPEAFLRGHHVLPVLKFGEEMTLAMADPTDEHTVAEVAGRTRLRVRRSLALASNLDEMLDHFFAQQPAAGPAQAAEVQHLQFHLVQALQQGAAEIHFEPPVDGRARVRYRVHGVLVDRPTQPADLQAALLRHLRALTRAGDAQVRTGDVPTRVGDVQTRTATSTVRVGEDEVVLAVTFVPTTQGETATVALYPRQDSVPALGDLGISEEHIRSLRQAVAAPWGVVVVGCADPRLRYELLHGLVPDGARGRVWTLETVSLYRRPDFTQTVLGSPDEAALHLKAAGGAGADLIVVADAADAETLRAAAAAGQTRLVLAGHPLAEVAGVLSQALDALGPALVASTLRAILVTRATYLLCERCRQPDPRRAGAGEDAVTYIPMGCEACGFTGFGECAVLSDLWVADAEVRLQLRSGRTAALFEGLARQAGRMRDQGLALLGQGLISADELAKMDG